VSTDAWNHHKEQVRQAIDIVDLVGSYVPLRRQGRRYVGTCPWHDDRRPSLQVNPDRQTFKCWVCDIGGDVFTFLMKVEGIDFRQAIGMLAERAGIAPPRSQGQSGATGRDEKQLSLKAMAWAEAQFHQCLLESPEAQSARQYLKERHVTDESIRLFHIGFVPNRWDWLLRRASEVQITPELLERVGLAVPRNDGRGFYDRFRGRVMFPIHDLQDRPIAMGGRILPEYASESPAKYINSPETPLFSKNQHLYGLNRVKGHLGTERSIVVVEGYTDCVVAHQFGFPNVVAVLGTALGERQVGLLRRFADSITLTLDGDEAGRRRAEEILELFVAMQVDLRILVLPGGSDPCDFLVAHGSEAFGRMLADAVDALEYKIRMATQGLDPRVDTHRISVALDEVLSTLARAPRLAGTSSTSARLREEQVLVRLAGRFHVPEEGLRSRLTALRRKQRPLHTKIEEPGAEQARGELDPWDRALIELVLRRPDWLAQIEAAVAPDDLFSSPGRSLYTVCLQMAARGRVADFHTLMLELEDPGLRNTLVQIDEHCRARGDSDDDLELEQTLESYRRRKEDGENRRRIAALQEEASEDAQAAAFDRLVAALKPRHRRSDPTDG
jgi:DNA primase